VRALCFSPDAQHAISAAEGERLVAVWVVPQQGGKKKPGGVAAASLAVAQPVVQMATAGKDCWDVGWVGQGLGCLMQSAAQTAAADWSEVAALSHGLLSCTIPTAGVALHKILFWQHCCCSQIHVSAGSGIVWSLGTGAVHHC
jgi:hypothetical protein